MKACSYNIFMHSLSESYSNWVVLSCGTECYAVQCGSYFEYVDETLVCDHSNESYWAVLPSGTVYYAVQVLQVVLTFAYVLVKR